MDFIMPSHASPKHVSWQQQLQSDLVQRSGILMAGTNASLQSSQLPLNIKGGEFSGKQTQNGIRKMEAAKVAHSLTRSQQERYLSKVLHPSEIARENNFRNAQNVVSQIEERARRIKNKIAQTKSELVKGDRFMAEGRSQHLGSDFAKRENLQPGKISNQSLSPPSYNDSPRLDNLSIAIPQVRNTFMSPRAGQGQAPQTMKDMKARGAITILPKNQNYKALTLHDSQDHQHKSERKQPSQFSLHHSPTQYQEHALPKASRKLISHYPTTTKSNNHNHRMNSYGLQAAGNESLRNSVRFDDKNLSTISPKSRNNFNQSMVEQNKESQYLGYSLGKTSDNLDLQNMHFGLSMQSMQSLGTIHGGSQMVMPKDFSTSLPNPIIGHRRTQPLNVGMSQTMRQNVTPGFKDSNNDDDDLVRVLANDAFSQQFDMSVREQSLIMTRDARAGKGQDDTLPTMPTMSMQAAMHDQELQRSRMMGDLMFVSNDRNVQGDLYIESEAEELYLPDSQMRKGPGFKRNGQSLVSTDEGGIIGYQKYMQIAHTIGQEPEAQESQVSHYVRATQGEADQEATEIQITRARNLRLTMQEYRQFKSLGISIDQYRKYQQSSKRGRMTMNSLQERTDEDTYGDETGQDYFHDIDDDKIKRYTKLDFSGLSFKDYVGLIEQRDLNREIHELVQTFTAQKLKKHFGTHLSQRKLQVKHPIFKLLSINAFKFIIDRAFLFKLSEGQAAYHEEKQAMKNVYFVLYGEFEYISSAQPFGNRVGLGWTIGEEILFIKSQPVKRLETVLARSEACLLQLKVSDLEQMPSVKAAAGTSLRPDYNTLMGFLASNYEQKTLWRGEVGLVPTSPRGTKSRFGQTMQSKGTDFGISLLRHHPMNSNIEFF